MASAQCNRPANETCQQKCQGSSSLGQKKSSWVKGSQNGQIKSKPICQAQNQAHVQVQAQSQAQAHSCPKQGTCKASGHQHTLHTHSHGHGHSHTKHQVTNGAACHCSANKTNGHHGHNVAATGGVSIKRKQQWELMK
ncbi:hypothetical protein TIFTF001_002851 [Ficus carica]|uniref:Uncharacterized protein n=1 Tax=Ficus carica TaxID=3494 RepID=A0AA88D916_FICCA|nr:hypothetical protein TIFTF001_002851 [Ficus carica]